MNVSNLVPCLLSLLLLSSCTTIEAPAPYPQLTADDADPSTTAIVREDDHCFIGSVDGVYIAQFQVHFLAPGTYRQHMIPPGKHTLAVFYRRQNNLDTVATGPRLVTVNVEAGKTYSLAANRTGTYFSAGDYLPPAYWRPGVVDDATKKTIALAPVEN